QVCLLAASGGKAEKPVHFVPAKPDPLMGDWQGTGAVTAAQVLPLGDGNYRALLLNAFDKESNVVTVLQGSTQGEMVEFSGDEWSAKIAKGHFTGAKAGSNFELQHVKRSSPTLGAKPPANAVVLFNGSNLDGWAKKNGKDWLAEDGPAKWKL